MTKDEIKKAQIEILEKLRNRAWNKSDWSAVVIELIDELELN